jgi:GTP cyclohydrolase I
MIPNFLGTVANDHIPGLTEEDRADIKDDVALAIESLLVALRIDYENDHNTEGTPERVARMYVDEVFKGRFHPPPKITDFPNAKALDTLYTIGPITVRSACSHHLVPILGRAWIGVIPGERVIGISKFHRLTEWVMSRPQIQEEATVQLADEIETRVRPLALAVVVKAQHLCMSWRGVREPGVEMATSVMRGIFKEDAKARAEFMSVIRGQGYEG